MIFAELSETPSSLHSDTLKYDDPTWHMIADIKRDISNAQRHTDRGGPVGFADYEIANGAAPQGSDFLL